MNANGHELLKNGSLTTDDAEREVGVLSPARRIHQRGTHEI